MPKKQKADARVGDIREKFMERCDELWGLHEAEFMAVLDDAESKRLNLSFTAELDFSESTAKLNTTMRFSQVVKDKKTDDFDDPNQPRLPGVDNAPEGDDEKPKKRGRPKKSGKDAAANDDTHSGD